MDNKNKSGAVRSADADLFSYTSLPMLGLIGVARTAAEGKTKYGRLNYKQGMPVHQYLDHAMHHIVLDLAGDRSQPNLEHAAWGLLAAIESRLLHTELNAPHDLGPGSTITPEIKADLDNAGPGLAARRKAGEFEGIGHWRLADIPDVQYLLADRALASLKGKEFAAPEDAKFDAWPDLRTTDDNLAAEMAEFLKGGAEPIADKEYEMCRKLHGDTTLTQDEANSLRRRLESRFGLEGDDLSERDSLADNSKFLQEFQERKAKERIRMVEAACEWSCTPGGPCQFPSFCRGADSESVDAKLADGWNLTPTEAPEAIRGSGAQAYQALREAEEKAVDASIAELLAGYNPTNPAAENA